MVHIFAATPSEAFGDLRLTGTDRKVLAAVAMHDRMGRNQQGCFAGRDTLADDTGFNPSNVSTSLSRLCGFGYLFKQQRGQDGRRHTYFVIYPSKKFARIPVGAIPDRRIHDAAFRVLGAVVMHDHGKGQGCWASRATLAKETGLKANTVSLALADLEEIRYIARQRSGADARLVRTYVLAFGEPSEKVAPHQPKSVALHQPILNEDSCPKNETMLPPVNLSDRDELPGPGSFQNEINGMHTQIYSPERVLLNFAEAKIDNTEADAERGEQSTAKARQEIATDCGGGNVAGLGRQNAPSIGIALNRRKPTLSNTPDPDTKIVNGFAGIGVGNQQSWIVLMSLPDSDVAKLRILSAEDRLTTQILREALYVASKPDMCGQATMNWSGLG